MHNLKYKKIEITEETLKILNLLNASLAKYATDLPVVNEDIHEEKGIWYAFIAKVEIATGTSLGATYKNFPQKDLQLDAFARTLLEDFCIYTTELLEVENISTDEITQTKISNKYVLIKEILVRLVSHALSIGIGMFAQGEALLKITDDFIQGLNGSDIMTKKQFMRIKHSTAFGTRLANNIDYWLKLMNNSVKVSELIHKNTHACVSCLNVLSKLKMITLRQIAVFLDATQLTSSYHDEMLPIKFKKLLAVYEINGLDELFSKLDYVLQKKILPQLNNTSTERINRLKKLFFLLAEITKLEMIFGQLSTMTAALGWFPVITGTFELTPLMQRLELLFEKARLDLKVDLESKYISDQERSILQHHSSYSTPSNLETSFIIVAKNLADLTNMDMMKKLMLILKCSAGHLIDLQNELGIVLINNDKLDALLKLNNESVMSTIFLKRNADDTTANDEASLPVLSSRDDFEQYSSANPFVESISPDISLKSSSEQQWSSTNPFVEQNSLMINAKLNKSTFFYEQHQTLQIRPWNSQAHCHVLINDQTLQFDNTYMFFQSNDKIWTLFFYKTQDTKPKNIAIQEIPDLQQVMNKSSREAIVDAISSYHISINLTELFYKKNFLEALNYIDANTNQINCHSWLGEIAMLYKSKCCYEIFKESNLANKYQNISATTQNLSRQQTMEKAISTSEKNYINEDESCSIS